MRLADRATGRPDFLERPGEDYRSLSLVTMNNHLSRLRLSMLKHDDILEAVAKLKKTHGLADPDEHIITTIHLMNHHQIDFAAARDRTSRGSGDKGIDGWYYDEQTAFLSVYQSKLSTARSTALSGLDGLVDASDWIACVLETGDMGTKMFNPALLNLASCLEQNRQKVLCVRLRLISPFTANELSDCPELDECRRRLTESALFKYLSARQGKLDVEVQGYDLTSTIAPPTRYEVPALSDGVIRVSKRTQLHLVYVYLAGLVRLFQTRGNDLFEKNVRLYLSARKAKVRLEGPLRDTLRMSL